MNADRCPNCERLNVVCICTAGTRVDGPPPHDRMVVCTCGRGDSECELHYREKLPLENNRGNKADAEKLKFELFSSLWMSGVAAVLTFGAKKYAAHNWRKGIERSRLLGACLRHVFAYLNGEDYDPETGLLHLDHASCCLMFASELHHTRPDTDDRFKTANWETSDPGGEENGT